MAADGGVGQEFPALRILTKWKNNLGSRRGGGGLIILYSYPVWLCRSLTGPATEVQSKHRQNRGKYCIYVHRRDSCKPLTEDLPPQTEILAANSYLPQHYQHNPSWKAGLPVSGHPSHPSHCRIPRKAGKRNYCQK